MRIISLSEFLKEGEKKFGKNRKNWMFVCPRCKTKQSAKDFIEAEVDTDLIENYLGFSCIGRFNPKKGCDWSLGGLFKMHTLEVKTDDGKTHPRFEFA